MSCWHFYLTETARLKRHQVISYFLGPATQSRAARLGRVGGTFDPSPSVHASRSRSKHPPTHARVRSSIRVRAADLQCEVEYLVRDQHEKKTRLCVGRVPVESSFAENIANSLVSAQVTERCCLDAPARLILRGERHPRSAALKFLLCEDLRVSRSPFFVEDVAELPLFGDYVMNVHLQRHVPHRLACCECLCSTWRSRPASKGAGDGGSWNRTCYRDRSWRRCGHCRDDGAAHSTASASGPNLGGNNGGADMVYLRSGRNSLVSAVAALAVQWVL